MNGLHQHLVVIGLCHPDTGEVGYFIMKGHPLGLTASVFNYNRRGILLTEFFVRDFWILAQSYKDDRYGCTLSELASEECGMIMKMCELLGVGLSDKTQVGQEFDIGGAFRLCISPPVHHARQEDEACCRDH